MELDYLIILCRYENMIFYFGNQQCSVRRLWFFELSYDILKWCVGVIVLSYRMDWYLYVLIVGIQWYSVVFYYFLLGKVELSSFGIVV